MEIGSVAPVVVVAAAAAAEIAVGTAGEWQAWEEQHQSESSVVPEVGRTQ
jgi:hypothetical protein